MIKKCSKILITILFVFLVSLIATSSVNAKEMTLDELSEAIMDYNSNTADFYMIGEYVFTSERRLTIEDIMLAARSINVTDTDGETNKDEIYGEMSITYFEGIHDEDGNLTGFEYVKRIAGTKEPGRVFDIKYIDYNLDAAKLKVDVDTLVNEAYNTIIGQNAKDFEFSKDGNKINVILKDTEMDSIEALMGTGVATAAANFLKEEGVAGVTLKIGDVSLPITGDTVDKTAVENFFKQLGSKAGDLVDKTMTVTVAFEDGYKTANSTEFTVTFGKVVDVNALVEKAYNTIKNQAATDKFIVSLNGNLIEVKLMDTEMNSLEAMAGTGVATAINNFFDESGIASVTLEIDGNPLTVTKDPDAESVNEAEIEAFLKSIGNKAGDLIGKPITATVTIKEGFEPLNESNTFGIEFKDADKVDVDAIVSTAFNTVKDQVDANIFEVTMNGSNIGVLIKDTSINSIEAIAGTGVATAATNFLKEEGVAGVTLKIGDVSLPITGDTVDKSAVEDFFKELGSTAADLVDKTMTVTVSFDEGYKTANSTEFTVTFGKLVDVNTLVNNAYETIKGQAATDKFVVGLNGTNVTVKLMDTEMNSIEAIAGTGVATAINNFFDESGIASVILEIDSNPLTITKDPNAESVNEDEIEAFLKSFGSKAGDLIGKPITATVKFKDGFKTANSDKFTINFLEATPVDVSSLVNDAYTTIIDRAATEDFEITMDGTSIEVFLKDFEISSVSALEGSGVGKAGTDFLKEEGIAGVTLTLGEAKLELGSTPINVADVENFFKQLGSKAGDLVGKTLTAKVLFEDGYKKVDTDTFYITFSPKKYDVKFNVDGTELTNELVVIGETATKPTDPSKEGYTFDKWLLNGVEFDFSTPIKEAITLEASWKINTYKINIAANDNTLGSVDVSELTVNYGTEITISENTIKIGSDVVTATPATKTAQYTYTFTEWADIVSPVTNSFTITANFEKTLNKYTVTYVDYNNETLGTEEVDYGTKVSELNPPTEDGKVATTFIENSVEIEKTTEIQCNTTLTVKYATAVDVDNTLSTDLSEIEAEYYTVALEEDIITTNFTDSNLKFTNMSFANEILALLETLTADDSYQSVKLSYDNNPAHYLEIKGDVDILSVARFVGLVTGGSYSGSVGMQADVNKLVTATANKPITVTVTMVDGYADISGEPTLLYDLIFTCE